MYDGILEFVRQSFEENHHNFAHTEIQAEDPQSKLF
jgi:hypothetical protein